MKVATSTTPAPEHLVASQTLDLPGHLPLVLGREFRVTGERGWYRVTGITTNTRLDAVSVLAVSTDPERCQVRAFRPERITRVSRNVAPPRRAP